MTRPDDLSDGRRAHLDQLVAACPEMTDLARLVAEFAHLMTERRGSDLDSWMKQVREARLPELDPFLRGLDQDHDAAIAGLTLPYSNGSCSPSIDHHRKCTRAGDQTVPAWIAERFAQWTDPRSQISDERMLTDISQYWLTATAASSARLSRAAPRRRDFFRSLG
ncbi:hypothetical protein AB0M45_31045 [Nocardia sp. NPDC051787]|uniref:hypothetical protein n=1 Tax=Nocardia sp. NPDC051787 TaxID=3155415 RepID=UPI003440F346